jgi:predicted secreted hydrolase
MKKFIWAIVGIPLLFAVGYGLLQTFEGESEISAKVSVAEAMGGGSNEGYFRANGPREFVFPEDHGPHPGFKTEWWYYTGNVFTEEGRQFGYQFTIFRSQLNPPDSGEVGPAQGADWNTDQLYLGHFAISDVQEENHVFDERYSRGAAGLAGAQVEPYRIWLEDWSIERLNPENSDDKNFPVQITAEMENGASINFNITPAKPLTLQGEDGFDKKGPEEGNASYYLSFTRMDTEGTIQVGGQEFEVEGQSWMDHEWSTSALDREQEGWDWFSLQFSNGYDMMYYQLRNKDGSVSSFTVGSLIDPEGNKTTITPEDVKLEILDRWESPHSGSRYPSEWVLEIPGENIRLELATLFDDQEMDVSVRYYEGTLDVKGSMNGEEIGGQGFIEMTGYEGNEE